LHKSTATDDHDGAFASISLHQLAAATDPRRSLKDFADSDPSAAGTATGVPGITHVGTRGNFQDFDLLFAQLAHAPVTELANPLPDDRYLPRSRVGSCPAAHNRALLSEDEEKPD
jgi:hypothetical protein